MTLDVSLLRHDAPCRHAARKLLVMLPGAGMAAQDFAANGMVSAVHERHLAVDIIAAQPALDLYLDGEAAAALHEAVIKPALAQSYSAIWLLGISLGGMGALLYTALHETLIEGVVLLAPFLGTPGTIAGVEAAGGLPHWTPNAAITTPEARMLLWLKDHVVRPPPRPTLHLGFGEADRFARGHRLLAAQLPPSRVASRAGGHDWETWTALWQRILDTNPFSPPPALDDPPDRRI